MLPWERRRWAPTRWFADCPDFRSAADDVERTVEAGLLRNIITADQLPDFAPWSSLREFRICLHVFDTCTWVLPSVPGRTSTQFLWLLVEQTLCLGPEDVGICWGELELLRPERSLAAYDLPADVDLRVWAHAPDAFRIHFQWTLIGMHMYVSPGWPLERVRRTVAFQLGVNPHQVRMQGDGQELLGGMRCDVLLPESLITVHVHGCPDSFNCDVCISSTLAASLCQTCGRSVCCRHRYQCRSCLQFVCTYCCARHACLQVTQPLLALMWTTAE